MSSPKSLVWLITGCSSGFGLSLSLLALKAGHKVIATSRNPSKNPELVKEVEELGGTWLALDMNAEPQQMHKVIAEGKKIYGRIDVLVNSAAIVILGPVEDFSPNEASSIMDTNFFGPFNLIQAVLPTMREQNSGTIVNISSAAGVDPRPSMSMYAASKWALEGLSEGLAKEVAPLGIRVLIVQPGAFTTNMMNAVTLTSNPLTEAYKDTETGRFISLFSGGGSPRTFQAPNDVEKGCQGIFEAVTGTGRGAGKEKFLRLPLSADCAERSKVHAENLIEGYEEFRDIWESTGHDGGVKKAFVAKN